MRNKINVMYEIVFTSFRYSLMTILFFSFGISIIAQNEYPWNNKTCAVCLTYDDALNVHLDNVVPFLDSLGFKATFYLPGSFATIDERSADWASVGKNGHELGNHTLFHPCEGKAPGREWVNPNYDLNIYTRQRIVDEIKMNNVLLKILDGKTKRSFAYTCGDKNFGDSSFVPDIQKLFISARGVQSKMQSMDEIDLYDVGSYMINGQTGDEMIKLVKNAMENNCLLVFLFHGVGGEHSINVSLEAHRQLVQFLKQNENEIWVAPFIEISDYILENR